MTAGAALPEYFSGTINLASPRLGTKIVYATDEFFAPCARMLEDSDAVFIADRFDQHGKWMDGWETRRRRVGGHDWCMLKLGVPGIVHGVDFDTSHFTGNFPPGASLHALLSDDEPGLDAPWRPLATNVPLGPSAHHYHQVHDPEPVNWLRLQIFPDGGIARLRIYGRIAREWTAADQSASSELSALKNGGRIIGYNDAHYGNLWAVLAEGRGQTMADGWETRRRREPGNDWLVIALGHAGTVSRIEVDTAHFKGNYPDLCSVVAASVIGGSDASVVTQSMFWPELLSSQRLKADAIHTFEGAQLHALGPITHVRLNIFPDGGVSRFRVFGTPA